MDIKPTTIRAWNDTHAQLDLEARRIEQLPIELGQLGAAIAAVAGKVDFDVDPFDFRVALVETAREDKA